MAALDDAEYMAWWKQNGSMNNPDLEYGAWCAGKAIPQQRDEAREELLRINTQRQHLLWYVADLIHERESKKAGNYLVVRWQCLRDDLKQKYIDEAMQTVTAWWLDEESARIARDEIRIL